MGTSDAERMENIRKTYHVQAHSGLDVRWADKKGTYRGKIVGARGSYLRVRRQEAGTLSPWRASGPQRSNSRMVSLHPHHVKYLGCP